MAQKLPKEFIEKCKKITAKRAKTVVDHILKHGHITTQELKDKYGYNHPPRAIRDAKEQGIPIEMFRVEGNDGRKIAAYRFGDPSKSRFGKLSGRTALTKELKKKLISLHGAKCEIYCQPFPERELQIDHRVPFEVLGDNPSAEADVNDFMLLSPSANRAKSWSCEHCDNWLSKKDKAVCLTCYWAFPGAYSHLAMKPVRRLDIMWSGAEVEAYDKLRNNATKSHQEMPAYVKEILRKLV
ncbi:MAG: HNH endonuclease [Elusimicrobiales bacterium]